MKPEDTIVLVLTAAVSLALLTAITVPYITRQQISDERAKNIGALVSAIIAIISLYIGFKLDTDCP